MIPEIKRYGHISAIIPKENKHDYMRMLPLIWLFPLNYGFQRMYNSTFKAAISKGAMDFVN